MFENTVLKKIFVPKRKVRRSLMICIPHQNYSGDEITDDDIGRPCSTHGERTVVYRVG